MLSLVCNVLIVAEGFRFMVTPFFNAQRDNSWTLPIATASSLGVGAFSEDCSSSGRVYNGSKFGVWLFLKRFSECFVALSLKGYHCMYMVHRGRASFTEAANPPPIPQHNFCSFWKGCGCAFQGPRHVVFLN